MKILLKFDLFGQQKKKKKNHGLFIHDFLSLSISLFSKLAYSYLLHIKKEKISKHDNS